MQDPNDRDDFDMHQEEHFWPTVDESETWEPETWADDYPEDMDGDAESALASAGFGTDEDYGYEGTEDEWLDASYEE